jgi:hypothetical protein
VNALAPDFSSVPERDLAILNKSVNRVLSLPLEDESIEARPAKAAGRPPALVTIRNRSGER